MTRSKDRNFRVTEDPPVCNESGRQSTLNIICCGLYRCPPSTQATCGLISRQGAILRRWSGLLCADSFLNTSNCNPSGAGFSTNLPTSTPTTWESESMPNIKMSSANLKSSNDRPPLRIRLKTSSRLLTCFQYTACGNRDQNWIELEFRVCAAFPCRTLSAANWAQVCS